MKRIPLAIRRLAHDSASLLLFFAVGCSTAHSAENVVIMEDIAVITEDGSQVQGKIAYPADVEPSALVVFVHGFGQTVEGAWLAHMNETAAHGAAVVSVDFRDNFGFPLLRGAQDTNHAARYALSRFPAVNTVILFGVSMGGGVSGVAIAEAPERAPNVALYDYWVDIEGVSNAFETWTDATAAGHPAAAGLERDAGGTPLMRFEAYLRRSPSLRTADLASLRGAFLVHALNDGNVLYDQGRAMYFGLLSVGVPARFTTVIHEPSADSQGTTLTGLVSGMLGAEDPAAKLYFAGHAWEGDRQSAIMSVALETLFALLAGNPPGYADVYR